MKKQITCPVHGTLAELHYEVDPEGAKILGVTACTLIEGEVDCEQQCVVRMRMRQQATLAHAAPAEND